MQTKTIYIRVDMNEVIATGHVMRCLSLADAALRLGIDTVFISADEKPLSLIGERGYSCLCLQSNWQDMEGELPALEQVIRERGIEKLLVDSYQVTPAYLERLSQMTKVIYLDDLYAFPYPVQGVLNYSCYADEFPYEEEKVTDTSFYLGCDYVPIREMFQNCPPKRIKDRVEQLLLMSGGNDALDMLDRTLFALPKGRYKEIVVLCGRYYEHVEELKEKYKDYTEIRILPSVTNMRDYYDRADLVICAGGTTMYEVCATGTPAISYAFADNQFGNVKRFDKDGLIPYAGDARYEKAEDTICSLLAVYDQPKLRRSVSEKMQKKIDGKGAQRVIEKILI